MFVMSDSNARWPFPPRISVFERSLNFAVEGLFGTEPTIRAWPSLFLTFIPSWENALLSHVSTSLHYHLFALTIPICSPWDATSLRESIPRSQPSCAHAVQAQGRGTFRECHQSPPAAQMTASSHNPDLPRSLFRDFLENPFNQRRTYLTISSPMASPTFVLAAFAAGPITYTTMPTQAGTIIWDGSIGFLSLGTRDDSSTLSTRYSRESSRFNLGSARRTSANTKDISSTETKISLVGNRHLRPLGNQVDSNIRIRKVSV